ncbi:MAG: type II secretion system protein N [Burkholderiaceae bacterium]
MKRLPWFASFAMFIALCASTAYWAMQLFQPPVRAVAAAPQAEQPALSLDAAQSLFGGSARVDVASNYQLKGVVAAARRFDSVAILSTDGKPAKAVAAGSELSPGVTVKEVHPQYVLLSESGVIKRVELEVSAKVGTGMDLSPRTPSAGADASGTSSAKATTVVTGTPNGMPNGTRPTGRNTQR